MRQARHDAAAYVAATTAAYAPVVGAVTETGGATFDRTGRLITSGDWMVGGVPGGKIVRTHRRVTVADIHNVVTSNPRATMFGAWRDTRGVVWLEPVEMVEDETAAVVLGHQRGEMAIFHLSSGREVTL